MDTHRTEIEKLVTTIVERDVGILAAGLQSQDKDDVAKQVRFYHWDFTRTVRRAY